MIGVSSLCATGDIIRVGVLVDVSNFNLSARDCQIFELKTSKKTFIDDGNIYNATLSRGNLVIAGKRYKLPVRITPSQSSFIIVNGKKFRDSLFVVATNSKMTVINEVGIENYVRGVLSREMSPDWPLEALKSQAVATRSFAVKNLGRHLKEGFDLCATVHCQVYGGAESENSTTDRATFETAGEILVDKDGQIINSVYHACCGGHTEDARNVWDIKNEVPHYFVAKKCEFCVWYKHYNWTFTFEKDFIRKKLRTAGYDIGRVKTLEVVGRSVSDRAKFIKVKHTKGTTTIPAAKFRLAVDPWRFKSTKLTAIVRHNNSFEFRGHGWGHGVGMCQAGSKGMADSGHSYSEILRFYYPGASIKKVR